MKKEFSGKGESSKELKALYAELKVNTTEKKEIYGKMEVIEDEIRELES